MMKPYVRALSAIALVLFTPLPLAAREKPAVEAQPSAPVAKGRLFAAVLGPGPKWKKGQPFKDSDFKLIKMLTVSWAEKNLLKLKT